jgi:murein DD-endopeptidase MepM/ murein hydrolase activator NlpD
MTQFPLDAASAFSDEFGRHQGTDIFAPVGTPVVAVDMGQVRFTTDPKGGIVAYLKTSDGTTYYYAHLSATQGQDRFIAAGDVLGYVGTTGNAAGTSPHLHFEVHPQGSAPVNPYPLLAAMDPAHAKGAAASSGMRTASFGSGSGWLILLALWALSKGRH